MINFIRVREATKPKKNKQKQSFWSVASQGEEMQDEWHFGCGEEGLLIGVRAQCKGRKGFTAEVDLLPSTSINCQRNEGRG